METTAKTKSQTFINSDQLLDHWQGHRRLTRKVIEAFPEDKLFTFSVGGMRPFGELAMEMITMAAPGVEGVVTRKWMSWTEMEASFPKPKTKADLLKLWDAATDRMNELWPGMPAGRFNEMEKFFGQWEGPVYWSILYSIDNEIHHRAQGYVYLRALGIEPPKFWER
jgi:uncharacterized damage-inducible protein DinB